MMNKRSPNLTPARIDVILGIIHAWEGRLTWPALVKAITASINCAYTRQALFNQERIRAAYDTYRANFSGAAGPGRPMSASLKAAVDRAKRLEIQLEEAKRLESLLLEQFVRWAYNASTRGLTEDFLNQPLPPLNRRGARM